MILKSLGYVWRKFNSFIWFKEEKIYSVVLKGVNGWFYCLYVMLWLIESYWNY